MIKLRNDINRRKRRRHFSAPNEEITKRFIVIDCKIHHCDDHAIKSEKNCSKISIQIYL